MRKFDFSLFLPRSITLTSLYLNENRLIELEGYEDSILPSLRYLGLTGNSFNCSFLKEFVRNVKKDLTLRNDTQISSSPHETNIHGIQCEPVDEQRDETTPVIIASTPTTLTTSTRATAIQPNTSDNVKHSRENFTILDTKQLTSSLTEAFSVFSQEHSDLQMIKTLLIFVSVMLSVLTIVILYINRDKLLIARHYRGFFERSTQQSTVCINNDFEVSTFNQDDERGIVQR